MKKVLSMFCAALLLISSAVTVFAQQSIVVTGVVQEAQSATDASGNPVEVSIRSLDSALDAATRDKIIQDLQAGDVIQQILGADYVEGMQVADVVDVTVPEGTAFPVTITFKVPGVTASSNVGVLHYTSDGAWEKIEAEAGDGTISGTFNSLSPAAFIVDKNTASAATNADGSVSPKTGESNTIAWAGAVAVLALAGMALTFRKKEA